MYIRQVRRLRGPGGRTVRTEDPSSLFELRRGKRRAEVGDQGARHKEIGLRIKEKGARIKSGG